MEDKYKQNKQYEIPTGTRSEAEKVKNTAQDEKFFQNLEANVDEIENEAAGGAKIEETLEQRATGEEKHGVASDGVKKPLISEDDARELLRSETARANQRVQSISAKNRKTLVSIIVVAVVLCLAGLGFVLMMSSKHDDKEVNKPVEPGVSEEEKKDPEEKPDLSEEPKNELIEVAIDDPEVQELYRNLRHIGQAYSSTLDFYTDEGVRKGDVSKTMMLDIALGNSAEKGDKCKTEHYIESGSESFEVGEVFGCRRGDEAREMIQEIFGKEIKLEDGDATGDYCGAWKYDSASDEFYSPNLGCGGSCLYALGRELKGAERDSGHLYIYETVYGGTCQTLNHVNGDLIAEMELDENGVMIKGVDPADYEDQLDQFKWTFTKNAEGNYVFTGLEKVER